VRTLGIDGLGALVVGGAGGIGQAIGASFLREGARLAVADLPGQALEKAVDKLAALADSAGVIGVECDVRSDTSIENAIEAAVSQLGALDALVNAAGIAGERARVSEASLADWEEVLRVNLTGAFLSAKYSWPHLVSRGAGAIVNIGSTAGKLPRVGQAAYCVSKAGLAHLTRTLALELAPHQIRVNAVCPGATDTSFLAAAARAEGATADSLREQIVRGSPRAGRPGIPLMRLALPEDHAELVVFLASPAARHITGQVIFVDGGEAIG
jgi:2,3-dihydro-2,3-dihydroxybenzoate dehydrogenase